MSQGILGAEDAQAFFEAEAGRQGKPFRATVPRMPAGVRKSNARPPVRPPGWHAGIAAPPPPATPDRHQTPRNPS